MTASIHNRKCRRTVCFWYYWDPHLGENLVIQTEAISKCEIDFPTFSYKTHAQIFSDLGPWLFILSIKRQHFRSSTFYINPGNCNPKIFYWATRNRGLDPTKESIQCSLHLCRTLMTSKGLHVGCFQAEAFTESSSFSN